MEQDGDHQAEILFGSKPTDQPLGCGRSFGEGQGRGLTESQSAEPMSGCPASTCLRVLRLFRRGAEGHRQLVTAWVENRILTASLYPDGRCTPFALRYSLPWRHLNHLKTAVCSQSDGSVAPC